MERLRRSIQYKDGWNFLLEEIEVVDQMRTKDPAKALELAKSILERISIKIATDRGVTLEDSPKTGSLIKKAFEMLPVIKFLSSKDEEASKAVLNAFATIATRIGEFRNKYGPISHGKDLYAENIDSHALLFSIDACDLVAAYLVTLDSFDVSERTRVDYGDYPLFNKKIDDEQDDKVNVQEIELLPSKALFGADFESYKELLYEFENEKKESIEGLCNSGDFVNTRKMCANLRMIREYLTDDEIQKIARAFVQNPQIYRIVKHGFTQIIYKWLIEEKSTILEESQLKELIGLKDMALY